MEPLYTAANVTAAYQLRWSLSLFATAHLPDIITWLAALTPVVERDGVRILEAHFRPDNVIQFYLSSRPEIAPPAIVKSVKGRLQHLLRSTLPQAFRRNFLLAAVGDAKREVVETYIATQLDHHRMSDFRVHDGLRQFQHEFPEVDLGLRQTTAHGAYLYNLHLVLVHAGRWNEVREMELGRTRDMVLRVAKVKGHGISRLALLPDHLHIVSSISPRSSPQSVGLEYLNNVAYAYGMRPVYSYSYYVGTVGELDSSAIQKSIRSS